MLRLKILASNTKKYDPLAEYRRQMRKFQQQQQVVIGGRFHKLARRLEATIPRGLRERRGTIEILLEVFNEEKQG